MSVVYHIPQAYVNSPVKTFKPSPEQAAAIRRYGIRVTPLEVTERLVSRPCKCGHVQEYTIDIEDTANNKFDAQQAIDRLSGDDWRCAFCAMPSLITYRAKSVGAGASGGSRGRSHRNRQSGASGNKRMTKREIERRIDRLNALINAYPNSERVAD